MYVESQLPPAEEGLIDSGSVVVVLINLMIIRLIISHIIVAGILSIVQLVT